MQSDSQVSGQGGFDLIVLGSGAGGLTAALSASMQGLRTLVLEHGACIGGTSARSSGAIWIPDNHYLHQAGQQDDEALAAEYLSSLVGERGDETMWRTFLREGPRMLSDLCDQAGLSFTPIMPGPDYRQDQPGALKGGRSLAPGAFDGRLLDEDFRRLASPLPELMLFGGLMVTRPEAKELLRADRSPRAAMLGCRLVYRYIADRVRGHGRGTRLVLGNALVAALLKALRERGVPVRTEVSTRRLLLDNGRVNGVEVEAGDGTRVYYASRGVVLAGGGFPANAQWRVRELPRPTPEYTPAAPGCNGSTIELALEAGAALGQSGLDNALWFPSSVARRKDGSTVVYPHIVLDRSKPGLIAINQAGHRFVNEAVSYHEFVRAMYREHESTPAVPAWLICDRDFIRRYGLGLIRPRTPSLRKYVASGYLREASDLRTLAERIGVPAAALEETVDRFNGFVLRGVDEDFRKGENDYDRSNGDSDRGPNPCIGPIKVAPYYALPVYPTPLGTSRGLAANTDAQVLDRAGEPIAGLYVCGNDMQSVFGGEYPGAGGQLGQAMTFGWIAGRHAAGREMSGTSTPAAARAGGD